MSSQYHHNYFPQNEQIYSILDSLESRLNRFTKYSNYGNTYNNNYYNYVNNNDIKEQDEIGNPKINQFHNQNIENNDIKKIISNEFNSLILDYQRDLNTNINSLESKINILNSRLNEISKNKNIINDQKQLYFNGEDYVSKEEYDSKIIELDHKLAMIDSVIIPLKAIIEKQNENNEDFITNKKNNLNNENEENKIEKNILNELNDFKKEVYLDIKINNQKIQENEKYIKELQSDYDYLRKEVNLFRDNNKDNLKDIINQVINDISEEKVKKENTINELSNQNDRITKLEDNYKKIDEEQEDLRKTVINLESKLNIINRVYLFLKLKYMKFFQDIYFTF